MSTDRVSQIVDVGSSPPEEGIGESEESDDQPLSTALRLPTSSDVPSPPSSIFLGHGKNKKPLDQLKTILDQYKIPYKIAVDEANQFRPISQKVAETMKSSGAAILLFTADEELRDANGDVVWRPSENVIYELGAASVLYGNRIIIFKEDSVSFPF